MSDPINAYREHLAARRAPRTVAAYVSVIEAFFAFVSRSPHEVCPSAADVERFLARPRLDGGRRAASSRNHELAALRTFATFAVANNGWPVNPTSSIEFVREPQRDPAVLSAAEVRRFFMTAFRELGDGERAQGLAIVAVLGQLGLRVHELVTLDVDQVDLDSQTLLRIAGKASTVHDLPLNAPVAMLLQAWLRERPGFAERSETALFVSSRGRRVSVRYVQRLIARIRRAMGTAKQVTPHTFRHTVATLALTMGTDLSTVSDLLRHSDLNTTRRYLHLVDERRRDAVKRLEATVPAEVLPPVSPGTSPLGNATADRPRQNSVPRGTVVEPLIALDPKHNLGVTKDAA